MADSEKLKRLLEIVRDEIIPLTESEVVQGSGYTGAAVVRADTLMSVMIGANCSAQSPLFHGSIDALNRFFKLPVRPDPSELIFVATHDPCPMCTAAIAIAGFKELWYIFPLESSEHLCEELFGSKRSRGENAYFTRQCLADAVREDGSSDLAAMLDEIEKKYEELMPEGDAPEGEESENQG